MQGIIDAVATGILILAATGIPAVVYLYRLWGADRDEPRSATLTLLFLGSLVAELVGLVISPLIIAYLLDLPALPGSVLAVVGAFLVTVAVPNVVAVRVWQLRGGSIRATLRRRLRLR